MKRLLPLFGILVLTACTTEPDVIINEPIDTPDISSESSPSTVASAKADESSVSSEAASSAAAATSEATPTSIPASVRIDMPFASQAPHGNWDPPYDEACEEASLIIVRHYLEKTALDANIMDKEILEMVAHEESRGLPIDIDMLQLATVAEEMFGYETEVIEGADVTAERIVKELANGNPVIVPLAGQDIGNPNYTGDGPPYHVLVIVGYNATQFITHDVGTRKGENYVYNKNVIMSAIHDWNGSVDTIRSGPRRILVVTKS